MDNLKEKHIAILATNGFEESELKEPKKALEEAGATVDIVSIEKGSIKSWSKGNWGSEVEANKAVSEVSQSDYHGLMIPGGVMNPDKLRANKEAVDFVRSFFDNHKPVAAICHGIWLLVEADVLNGKKVTSYHSIQTDVKNAGAEWVDEEVVVDEGLVTSREPKDLPAFNRKMVEEFREGKHAEQTA